MTPIERAAGILRCVLARAAGTLVFNLLGHWILEIGLCAFWGPASVVGPSPSAPLPKRASTSASLPRVDRL
jgi:hypothetical protein